MVWGFGFWVLGLWFMVYNVGFRVYGLGFTKEFRHKLDVMKHDEVIILTFVY